MSCQVEKYKKNLHICRTRASGRGEAKGQHCVEARGEGGGQGGGGQEGGQRWKEGVGAGLRHRGKGRAWSLYLCRQKFSRGGLCVAHPTR